MVKFIFILILISFFHFKTKSQSVVIKGKFENEKNKKVKLYISHNDDIVFSKNTSFQGLDQYETRSDNKGDFIFKIGNIQNLLYLNYIDIGGKKIYIGIQPNDSIFIEGSNEKIIFSGRGAQKNYFLNHYNNEFVGNRFIYRQNMNTEKFDLYIKKMCFYYLSDIQSLIEFKKEYSIEPEFVKIYTEVLKYSFYNDIFITLDRNPGLKKNMNNSLLDSFNINNNILKLDYIYHSALFGYLNLKLYRKKGKTLNNCFDLNEIINYSNKILSDSLRDYHWSYLIGFNLWTCNNKNTDFKNIVLEYLENANVPELKKLIREKAIYKKVISQ